MAGRIERIKGLYKRNGIWHVRVPVGDGEYERKSLGTRDYDEAATKAISLRATATGDDTRVLWKDFVDRYRREHFKSLRPKTRESYAATQMTFGEEMYGEFVRAIDDEMLDEYVTKRRKTCKSSSIRIDLANLSAMLGWAEAWGYISKNPIPRYLKLNKRKLKPGAPHTRWLSISEETVLLDLLERYAYDSDKGPAARLTLRVAVIIALDVGLRIGELMQLEWAWINWERCEVTLPKEVTKADRERTIPLLPRVFGVLDALAQSEDKHHRWVFPDRHGTGPRVDMDRALTAFLIKHWLPGRKRFGWHDLRRTCGCRLLQEHKLSMERVSHWLGHASIGVTERHYAFLSVDALHEAVGTGSGRAA